MSKLLQFNGAEWVEIARNGRDGVDGKSPTDAELTLLIKPLIPAPIAGKGGADGKAGVDGAPGKDGQSRIGWGAHPLVIQGSGVTKTKVARTINFTGATVSQSVDGVTTVATPSGTFSVTETEIDFGSTPLSEKSFTITDAAITSGMKMLTSVSYAAPTGKDQDELEMDDLQLRAVAGTGNFTLYVRAADGSYLADKFKIFYSAA